MISTNIDNEIKELNLDTQLKELFSNAGIPVKYHFKTLTTDWSKLYSPSGALTGLSKKRSEDVYNFVAAYMKAIPNIISGKPLKVKTPKAIHMVSDLIFDGSKSSGKTLLMSLIAQEAIKKGCKVAYIEWTEYSDRFMSFEQRSANEDYYNTCLESDFLFIDNFYNYETSYSKFFIMQFDRLITHRVNKGKITVCSIDTVGSENPVLGFSWNKFSRETFTFKLPGTELNNENKSKRTRA
jgi:DNA replication protein DnaC